jgi:hypothetical protein
MPGDKNHREQVTANRKKEKRVVSDRNQKDAQWPQLQKEAQQVADRQVHEAIPR